MIDPTRLAVARSHANVGAFLRVIREGESSQTDDAYRMRWGGLGKPVAYFSDFAKHPRIFERTTGGRVSSAAGAYQIVATTYDLYAPGLGITDFSPASQDAIAIAIIDGEGALGDVMSGRIETAIAKLRDQWTSLPGAAENARLTLAHALAVYTKYGGVFGASDTQPAAPIEDRSTPHQEPIMPLPILALVSAFGPLIAQMIPQVAKLFAKPESAVATRNVEAIQVVFDTIAKATQTDTVQAAVEAMVADPAKREAAKLAVVTDPAIMSVLEIGEIGAGGIAAARAANTTAAQDKPLHQNPAFIISLIALPMVAFVIGSVLVGEGFAVLVAMIAGASTEQLAFVRQAFAFSQDMKNVVIGAVMSGMAAAVMAFWFGTTWSSARKTDQLASQTDQQPTRG